VWDTKGIRIAHDDYIDIGGAAQVLCFGCCLNFGVSDSFFAIVATFEGYIAEVSDGESSGEEVQRRNMCNLCNFAASDDACSKDGRLWRRCCHGLRFGELWM